MKMTEAAELVVRAGRRLVESGLVARTWGNVSCRLDDVSFAITPSGRDYMSLSHEDIIRVKTSDCSYTGDIKPSSEKGIHAAAYRLRPDISFVIHTHQVNASAVSASAVESMDGEVPCAAYALPGTKKLLKNVSYEIARSGGNTVIMKNHGVLCLGRDYEEAFSAASWLEAACMSFIIRQYMKISGNTDFDEKQLLSYSVSRLGGGCVEGIPEAVPMPVEASLYGAIYGSRNGTNCIISAVDPYIAAASCREGEIRPMLDDFAQIVGTNMKIVDNDPGQIKNALRHSSAVLIRKRGALCCGATKADAAAVAMIVEKNCRAVLTAALFGEVKPLNPLECILMRQVYLKKYSKLQPS
ncbi:MAG TPA: class II aldolase/adducin family protein [Negativicutes bacterium]|nr:class II aldolase/adducin family protein [Negativicutes bacterium]